MGTNARIPWIFIIFGATQGAPKEQVWEGEEETGGRGGRPQRTELIHSSNESSQRVE